MLAYFFEAKKSKTRGEKRKTQFERKKLYIWSRHVSGTYNMPAILACFRPMRATRLKLPCVQKQQPHLLTQLDQYDENYP